MSTMSNRMSCSCIRAIEEIRSSDDESRQVETAVSASAEDDPFTVELGGGLLIGHTIRR
jgi:hypothetical protein